MCVVDANGLGNAAESCPTGGVEISLTEVTVPAVRTSVSVMALSGSDIQRELGKNGERLKVRIRQWYEVAEVRPVAS